MKKNRKSEFHFGVTFLWIMGVIFLSMMSVKGVNAEEHLPESTPTPIMMFRLDGVCTDEMVYVKLDGESDFATLKELVATSKVTKIGENQYKVENSITNALVYVKYDPAKQMLQGDILGISEDTATQITQAQTYFIQVDPKMNTITWAYSKEPHGEDAYLEHGRAKVIAIEGISDFHDIPFANNPGDEKGGHIAADAGKKVTIKLIPDYGYQLSGVQLNGGLTIEPDPDQMFTFTFTMPNTNVHFKGIFTKTEDKTEINTQSQSISSVSISNGANATGSGNLQLTVADSTGYDMTAAQQKVAGAISAQAVELNLKQLVAQGNGTNWETKITEFTNPITLSLGINNYDANYDYVVVRDHNGTTTALPTKVIDGKVTFETNQFSTYVIVKKEKATAGTSTGGNSHEDSKGNDDNSSDAQPAATQAVTQELDVVPKTGEGIAAYVMEIILLSGGILLITMGIRLKRKHR
jgi:hypothetical protein